MHGIFSAKCLSVHFHVAIQLRHLAITLDRDTFISKYHTNKQTKFPKGFQVLKKYIFTVHSF